MRRLLLLATAAAAATMVPSTGAVACGGFTGVGPGTTGTIYIVDDGGGADWIYVETNGTDSLQRGDGGMVDSTSVYSASDGCGGGDGQPDSKLY